MLDNLSEIESGILSFSISDQDELEQFRLKFLSRKGLISRLFDELKTLNADQKRVLGKRLNEIKKLADDRFNKLKASFEEEERKSKKPVDLTLPARKFSIGREHIIIQTLNEFCEIFRRIGFKIAEGPEIEDEFLNFDALNTPDYHPARDIQDTFYLDVESEQGKRLLLRTHTSPVQVRTMLANKPPVRIISPGKAFRNETVTPKNYFMFHQVEGLYVDEHVSFRDLKAVLNYFVKMYFGEDIKPRMRPRYFPFTEPSAELDITCFICKGKGCRVCKNTGWIELGGCGMVHPNVFKAVGYDPEVYTGYAFGIGMERIAMMKYGIQDIRLFYQNDVRFLDQF